MTISLPCSIGRNKITACCEDAWVLTLIAETSHLAMIFVIRVRNKAERTNQVGHISDKGSLLQ